MGTHRVSLGLLGRLLILARLLSGRGLGLDGRGGAGRLADNLHQVPRLVLARLNLGPRKLVQDLEGLSVALDARKSPERHIVELLPLAEPRGHDRVDLGLDGVGQHDGGALGRNVLSLSLLDLVRGGRRLLGSRMDRGSVCHVGISIAAGRHKLKGSAPELPGRSGRGFLSVLLEHDANGRGGGKGVHAADRVHRHLLVNVHALVVAQGDDVNVLGLDLRGRSPRARRHARVDVDSLGVLLLDLVDQRLVRQLGPVHRHHERHLVRSGHADTYRVRLLWRHFCLELETISLSASCFQG